MVLQDPTQEIPLPQRLEIDVSGAIEHLLGILSVEQLNAQTHTTIIVSGWNNNEECRNSLAVYLVGLCVSAIDTALRIRASLLDDDPESGSDIFDDVCSIVATTNDELSTDQKQDERNPWIAEGLWHLCMLIASRKTDIHPIGDIISVGPVHVRAKDHGLDGLAIYQADEDSFGLSIIESKAYKSDPDRAISKAVKFFKEIDNNKHSARVRHSVHLMRSALDADLQEKVSGSFWRRIRTYIPNPHYDSTLNVNWTNTRPSFNNLTLTKDNIIVMPHIITEFDNFFDQISNLMRDYARGYLLDV